MQKDESGRKPDLNSFTNVISTANEKLERLFNEKLTAITLAIKNANATIKPHKLLILVDLQGIYLGLHKWISGHNVPIDDGLILARFAQLQIERTAKEVAIRLVNSEPRPSGDLKHLFESVEINYVADKAYLGKQLDVLKEGTYLDISMNFEMFYAPAPLKDIEWQLRKYGRDSSEAKDQLRKLKLGVVTNKGTFGERNYKVYDDFVSYLKQSIFHSCSHEGFFNHYVGAHGLKNFDEKEVDIRIAIRAMDALHNREADSICIISSDQDFIPLHERADDFGVKSFQADLAKILESDKVGKKLESMGERFIRGGVEPLWPLDILTRAMSAPGIGQFAQYNLSEQELHALCHLHNELNDWKIMLEVNADGNARLRQQRPC